MPNLLPAFRLNHDYLDQLHSSKTFNIYFPKRIPGRKHEQIEISTDNLVFRLKDKIQQDVVSLIVVGDVEYFGSKFFEVRWSKSSVEKRNYQSYLFNLLLIEFGFKIISDKFHTSPGSKEYWLSLGQKKIYNLFIYNTDTDYKRKYENVSEEKIWGLTKDYLEEINELIFDSFDLDSLSEETETESAYEFEGFDEIDLEVLNTNVATKEIYAFVKKYSGKIEDKGNVRLIAQKA